MFTGYYTKTILLMQDKYMSGQTHFLSGLETALQINT